MLASDKRDIAFGDLIRCSAYQCIRRGELPLEIIALGTGAVIGKFLVLIQKLSFVRFPDDDRSAVRGIGCIIEIIVMNQVELLPAREEPASVTVG